MSLCSSGLDGECTYNAVGVGYDVLARDLIAATHVERMRSN